VGKEKKEKRLGEKIGRVDYQGLGEKIFSPKDWVKRSFTQRLGEKSQSFHPKIG